MRALVFPIAVLATFFGTSPTYARTAAASGPVAAVVSPGP